MAKAREQYWTFLFFLLTVAGSVGLLTLAVWPGLVGDVVFSIPMFCLSLPFLICWFAVLVFLAIRDLACKPVPDEARRRWGLWTAAIALLTVTSLRLHIPPRIVFALCGGEMRSLVDAAPTWNPERMGYDGFDLGRRFGPYLVDRYAADQRGGVYFRTHAGPDGIGPDTMSYGFAFRPNSEGTPFGQAHYRHAHLFGEWHVFAASTDW